MQTLPDRYYKFNRISLILFGLWPYNQKSCFVRMQNALCIIVLTTFLIAQLLIFATTQYDLNLVVRVFSLVFPNIFSIMKYCLFLIRADNVREMLDQIQDDWDSLKDKLEIGIMIKYANNMKHFTVYIIAFYNASMIIFLLFELRPMILDVLLPLNESRPCQLFVATEYFVSKDKHIYALLTHEFLCGYIVLAVGCSTVLTLLIIIQHACALFKISSYRIENAIEETLLEVSSYRKEYLINRRIMHAAVMHQKAIEFLKLFSSNLLLSFVLLMVVGVCSLTFNFFQFLEVITLANDLTGIIVYSVSIASHLGYMYICNYAGQNITDHGLKVFTATYNGLWYAAPLRTQKLILCMMQKGSRNVTFVAGGMFVASLEGFATLVSTAVSYLTVMYKARN